MSEEPAQETGTATRQGAGNSAAPPGHGAENRPVPPGSGMGPMPSPPPPGSPGPTGRVEQGGRRALWFGAASLVLTVLFVPVGLIAAVTALIVGVRARRQAKRDQSVAPGAVGGIVMGAIGLAFSALSLTMTAFLWSEMRGYQECISVANTNTDEQFCQDTWFPKIEDKLHLRRGSMSPYGDLF